MTSFLTFHLNKNFGLVKLVRAGKVASAPNKQKDMDPITRVPNICTGTNTENNRAEKPTTTERPLNKIPFPDIRNVFVIA